MKKLLLLVALAAVAYKGYNEFFADGGKAFDEQGNPQVLLFVHDGCGKPCSDAVNLLTERRVAFEEISVTDGREPVARWERFGAVRAMPYLVVGNDSVTGYDKWEMISVLAENFDSAYLSRYEYAVFSKNFTAEGEPKLVMYSMNGCGYCDKARDYFDAQGYVYEERNISVDGAAKNELAMFQAGTPLIFYGYRRFHGWSDSVRKSLTQYL